MTLRQMEEAFGVQVKRKSISSGSLSPFLGLRLGLIGILRLIIFHHQFWVEGVAKKWVAVVAQLELP